MTSNTKAVMLMYELFKKRVLSSGSYVGDSITKNSNAIMENTWFRDPQAKVAYLYDYDNDEKRKNNKEKVDIKFIVTQYNTLAKDQVEYHVQFKPGAHYDVGLYIDIPDDTGVYKKWLICSVSKEPTFVKYSVLPCNYVFYWTKNDIVYSMDGVLRLRNSYNSGLYKMYTYSPLRLETA